MKQWKAADISALDINMTENGWCLPWHELGVVVETPCVDVFVGVPGHGTSPVIGDCQESGGGEETGTKGPGETSGTGDTNAWS